jgi:hypothetical protein
MAKSDLKSCVVFRSSAFNANWPNSELGVEKMEELGKDCAEFLAQKLRQRKGITEVSGIDRDDWGWSFYVNIGREKYALIVMGAMGPQPIYWWTIQVRPAGLLWRLLRRSRKHFSNLLRIVDDVLKGTDSITDVAWATPEEYLALSDVETLEARRNRR